MPDIEPQSVKHKPNILKRQRKPARRPERTDPLAHKPQRPPAPSGRPPRSAASRRSNRFRIRPVVAWNARLRALRNLLFVALLGEVIWLGATSPLLVVRNVTVTGATVRPPDEIRKVARLTKPMNLFRAPTRNAVRLLRALPEVASARVERHFPNSLAIMVTERAPLATVLTPQGCWVMDGGGIVFRKIAAPLVSAPVFVMTPAAPIVVGKALPMPALKAALASLTGVAALPLARNVRVHLEENGDIWLQNTNGLKIRLGQLDDAPARLTKCWQMLKGPNGPDLITKMLVLDITSPDNPYTKRRPEFQDFRFAGAQNK